MKNIKIPILLATLVTLFSLNSKAQITSRARNINFTKFEVTAQDCKVAINLATDGAVPTNYFEIQKSADGVNFKTIALILGPDPKQSTCDCYGCFDKLLRDSKNSFYRAKHIGTDGAEQLSDAKLLAKL